MTELEKIAYAKSFIDKLANGINPLDDTLIPEGDIVNNVRLSRCFFYISDVLRQVIDNGGVESTHSTKIIKKEFSLTEEERKKIIISEFPLTVSEIAKYLNDIVDLNTTKKISPTTINNWLIDLGCLEITTQSNGKTRKTPTNQGKEIGIFMEERSGQYGMYITVLFSSSAQQFIYDNIDALIAFKNENSSKNEKNNALSEFHNRPWTETHDRRLIEMFEKNLTISEMAYELRRTEMGVRARLKELER